MAGPRIFLRTIALCSPLAAAEAERPHSPCRAADDVQQVRREDPPAPVACPRILLHDPARVRQQLTAEDLCPCAEIGGLQENVQMRAAPWSRPLP